MHVGVRAYHVSVAEVIPNLRDIGGVAAAGGTVRTGLLLRSALPAIDDLAPDGLAWPPALVVDLRSPMEFDQVHPLQFRARQIVNLPLLSELDPTTPWPETLTDLYLAVLTNAPHLLVELVGHVAAGDGSVLIHCAAGKDRTGIAIALILRLLGVEREHVIADYLLTIEAEAAIARRLGASTLPGHFLDVPVGAIEAVIDLWDAHDDGTLGWYLAAGGSAEDVSQLVKRLVE